jgi:glycosyltransferase involved in cell wall biosynthesis
LEPSVSVFVPVCNAQGNLEAQVERILDLLPELTSRFDVLIIDDGSTDETPDVARGLVARYPQVDLLRLEASCGMDEAIRAGLARRPTGVVMVHTVDMPLDAGRLRRFCKPHSTARIPKNGESRKRAVGAVSDKAAVKASARPAAKKSADLIGWMERLMGWTPPWPSAKK